jgi:hypothetical protein
MAKNFYEDFLRCIGGVRRIVQDPVHKAVNRLVKVRDQPGVSLF